MRRALYPGTFDPIHLGHADIATRASALFDEVVVGVYDRPQKKVLFSTEERVAMAQAAFDGNSGLVVKPYAGLTVDYAKEIGATAIVRGLRVFSDFELEFRMALANHRLAPDIEVVCLITSEDHTHLSSSTVREIASLGGDVSSMVTPNVTKALLARFRELGEDAHSAVDMVSLRD
jgi:pantetheine-phosphate adenylyltransferase